MLILNVLTLIQTFVSTVFTRIEFTINNYASGLVYYFFRFILIIVLGLCTRIKKTYDFVYFQKKTQLSIHLTIF